MTPEELEGILDGTQDPERRATAYAALTLTRVLASSKATSGPSEELRERLDGFVAKLRGEPPKPELPFEVRKLLRPDFLASLIERDMIERLQRSWAMADRNERRDRLNAVYRLVVELENIKTVSDFGTALGGQV